jgi:RecA/RadA recombinase
MAWKVLDGAAATGASSSIKTNQCDQFTVQVAWTDGTDVTAFVIDLEGSLDDTNFYALANHTASAAELAADGLMFHVDSKLVNFVRANITTLTDAGTPSVDVWVEARSSIARG